jgi:hypothetical protein
MSKVLDDVEQCWRSLTKLGCQTKLSEVEVSDEVGSVGQSRVKSKCWMESERLDS